MKITVPLRKGKLVITNLPACYGINRYNIGKDVKTGEPKEILADTTYYTTLSSLINSILDLGMLNSDAKSLKELFKEIKELKELVKEALQGTITIQEKSNGKSNRNKSATSTAKRN